VHVPVLAGPAIEWLNVRENGVYVDCTAGAGGHAALIAARLTSGRLIALDRDPSAVERTTLRLQPYPFASVHHRNYGELATLLAELGLPHVDGVLLDAGVSSMQLDEPDRGFSLQAPGPLDMRMDSTSRQTAQSLLESINEEELAELLVRYGDVPRARRIARGILARRDENRLTTTADLSEAVAHALNLQRTPEEARTVFQAIRIAVNDELRWLEAGLEQAIDVLAPGGRLVVIAFHSGEDRIVKNVLRDASRRQQRLHPDGRVAEVLPPRMKLLTRKPVLPNDDEVRDNPRAHSAKLRAAERLGEGRS
jgi:16S rRNA (cytosine1402-N4)-methyltransferase